MADDSQVSRTVHAGMALFWLLAVTAAFVAPIYLIVHYTDHTATAAFLGIAVGMWVRDYFMEYVRHSLGVMNPRWAENV